MLYNLVFSKNKKFWAKSSNNLLLSSSLEYNNPNLVDYFFESIPIPFNFYESNYNLLSEVIATEALVLKDLSIYLNYFHNESYSEFEWKIIIGPWLRLFLYVYITVNRNIDVAFKKFNIQSVSLCIEDFLLTSDDYTHFQSKLAEDHWNTIFVSQLVNNYIISHGLKINVNYVSLTNEKKKLDHNIHAQYNKLRFRDNFRIIITRLYNLIPINQNGPAIFNSFLPFYYDFLLKISNFQSPLLLKVNEFRFDNENRRIKISKVNSTSISCDVKLLFLCVNYLPKSYNENFKAIKTFVSNLNWPKNPNFIFTSNNHISDDFFKIWVVPKINNGAKYFIGQHGGGFTTHINPWVYKCLEEQTADKFLIWGTSKNKILNYESAFILKSPKLKYLRISFKKKSGILFIVPTIDHRDPLFHYTYDFLPSVLKNYILFFSKIHYNIKINSTIRLRHDNIKSFGNEYVFLSKNISDVKFEFGKVPIKDFVKKFKLIIHGYDSTGFLETLSNDIPSLAFLNPYELDLLKKDALEDYELLIKFNLVFTDPIKLSVFINDNYFNIHEWWYSDRLINVKLFFIEKYCKKENNPIKKLNRIFHD